MAVSLAACQRRKRWWIAKITLRRFQLILGRRRYREIRKRKTSAVRAAHRRQKPLLLRLKVCPIAHEELGIKAHAFDVVEVRTQVQGRVASRIGFLVLFEAKEDLGAAKPCFGK